MGAQPVVESLIEHYTRTWDMVRGAIEAFPDDGWRAGDVDQLVPARQALHIVETADYYSGEWEGAEMIPWGARLDYEWEACPRDKLPSQADLLSYLDEVKAKVEAWLTKRGDDGLLGEPPDKCFPWTGACDLSRALFLIRHTHHHLGKIHSELRRRGIARPDWR